MAYRIHPDVARQAVGGELVLLNTRSGRYYRLNQTGRLMVSAMEDGADPAGIAAAVARQFDVSIDIARRDADALLTRLLELGIVRNEDDPRSLGKA